MGLQECHSFLTWRRREHRRGEQSESEALICRVSSISK
ncbi:unnamed protein product [Musa acuminata var. zebrina]